MSCRASARNLVDLSTKVSRWRSPEDDDMVDDKRVISRGAFKIFLTFGCYYRPQCNNDCHMRNFVMAIEKKSCCSRFFRNTARLLHVDDRAFVPFLISGVSVGSIAIGAELLSIFKGCIVDGDHETLRIVLPSVGILLDIELGYTTFAAAQNFGKFFYRPGGAGKYLAMSLAALGFVFSAGLALAGQIGAMAVAAKKNHGSYIDDQCISSYIPFLIVAAAIVAVGIVGAIVGYVVEKKNSPDNRPLLDSKDSASATYDSSM